MQTADDPLSVSKRLAVRSTFSLGRSQINSDGMMNEKTQTFNFTGLFWGLIFVQGFVWVLLEALGILGGLIFASIR